MAKKKRQPSPPKPAQFAVTPFSALKGVAVTSTPEVAKTLPKTTPAVQPAEDDSQLFLQAMADTKRLPNKKQPDDRQTKGNSTHTIRDGKSAKISPDELASMELFKQEIGRLKLEVKFSEQQPDEDELKPLSGNRLKQLKRGIVTVDHQLDLHGLTRDEALAELPRFLRSARSRGQAAALVITGKGLNSPDEPVLQQAVAGWLRDAGREYVLEYAPAPREMGGSGAFVVFLRPVQKTASQPS